MKSKLLIIIQALLFLLNLCPISLFPQQGQLIGLTEKGGIDDAGVIYQTLPGGSSQVLKEFRINNGAFPTTKNLCEANNGKLYGLTAFGGIDNRGTIFEYDPDINTYNKKIDFDFQNIGGIPIGGMIKANNGKLYGMCANGGLNGWGTIYEYVPETNTITKLIDFMDVNDPNNFGGVPRGNLIQASNGKLYGMTQTGGSDAIGGSGGVIFEYTIETETIIKVYDFVRNSEDVYIDGNSPEGSLFEASNGLLYGMTDNGGSVNNGVIFQFNIDTYEFTKLFDFDSGIEFNDDELGANPEGSFMEASNGKLYATTRLGGTHNDGVIFEFDPVTNVYTKRFDFYSIAGTNPSGDLVQVGTKLYGLTWNGGVDDSLINPNGTLFELELSNFSYSVIETFKSVINGHHGFGTLVHSSNGNLYGLTTDSATSWGGDGFGTLFEYDVDDQTFNCKLYIGKPDPNGGLPKGKLVQASNCKTYGTTTRGGNYNNGILFEYDAETNTTTKLLDFQYFEHGSRPIHLIQASNGNLYGTTEGGGEGDRGVLYQYNIETSVFTKLVQFDYTNGNMPTFLAEYNNSIYGVTTQHGQFPGGVLYQYNLTTNSYSIIKDFDLNSNEGYEPTGLVLGSNGNLYGTTSSGGSFGAGIIYEYDINTDTYIDRYDFTGGSSSRSPSGEIIIKEEQLYGSTIRGGTNNFGTLYQFDLNTDSFALVHSFSGLFPTGVGSIVEDKVYVSSFELNFSTGTYGNGALFEFDLNIDNPNATIVNQFTGENGSAPFSSISEVLLDTDGDGIPDCKDDCDSTLVGISCDDGNPCTIDDVYTTDCGCEGTLPDSDNDTVPDCEDVCPDFDDLADVDADGIPDGCDPCNDLVDTDGDGTPDCNDLCPNDPDKIAPGDCGCGVPDTDADGDGTPDCNDLCPNDPGKVEPGDCGCGVADLDSDGDGIADCNDICPGSNDTADADGDGIPDGCDDGCDNSLVGTSCDDGDPCTIDDVYDKDCGCSGVLPDSDNDTVPDCEDICPGYNDLADADGDGIPDGCEDELVCETAYAKGNSNVCFIDSGFNNWGWTNQFDQEGIYSLDLYAGAGGCNLDNGVLSGTVTVDYQVNNLLVIYNLYPGFVLKEAHVYVGCTPFPKKGKNYTVAPGQYTIVQQSLNNLSEFEVGPIDISDLDTDIYVIAHAVVCEVDCGACNQSGSFSPQENVRCKQENAQNFRTDLGVKVYPNPASEILNITSLHKIENVSLFDLKGREVFSEGVTNEIDITDFEDGLYLLKIVTNEGQVTKKIIVKRK
ncbi:T9SS type A sorting domain-containing protein [Mangrovimonas sp. CR14]|uniref:choice-of-anchor tandem repeat GloVer-containing protein n=1 Tax=Mangrovimonas sp. CR14 TaxID=2706120 RepID=UPI00141E8CA0|nr:choice-of-anchor tandem repeat GloVer-containing protein [Mangrovimonas sp. CR14]NIK92071.1 T9SS type A sorting domain-containing protein [Mangrovimonas sp. CR14]